MPVSLLPGVQVGDKVFAPAVIVPVPFSVQENVVEGLTEAPKFNKIGFVSSQAIIGAPASTVAFGVKTTKSVKKIGCANLKTLIENDKLIINDFDTIAELNTFVRTKDTYAAEEGNNDDIVMGLVLFAWLTAQTFFKDETRIDIRKVMLEEQNLLGEESMLPFGFIEDGLRKELEVEDGDMWEPPAGYLSSNM